MPPLYKRYVPPKPAQASGSSAPIPAATTPINGTREEKKKRKRERSADEVAQRKAKKLDRKTVKSDVAAVETSTADAATHHPSAIEEEVQISAPPYDNSVDTRGIGGEFSHIKNAKKRHKLEKAARKARKAAERIEGQDHAESTNPAAGDDAGQATAAVRTIEEPSLLDDSPALDAAGHEIGLGSRHPDVVATAPVLKKRRHKLESILNRADDSVNLGDEPQDTEHLRKHSSVLSKFQKAIQAPHTAPEVQTGAVEEAEEIVAHDLVPLPQPAPRALPTAQPAYSTLPEWLEKPVSVPQTTVTPFADLGLDERLVDHLSKLRFRDALPVQQAVIPLLLPPGSSGAKYFPGTESVVPDLAISAPTGSGKTLAYLLPIIEQLKATCGSGNLAALVVVPTRELVSQVAAIATSLSKGSRVSVGMATGTMKLKEEQERLVIQSYKYDRAAYQRLITQGHHQSRHSDEDDSSLELEADAKTAARLKYPELVVKAPPNHVPCFNSPVDLLVCTPGRLTEHLKSTTGFSLAHLRWLVLDEADKLLDEQYDGFIELLQTTLSRPHTEDEQDAREAYLRQSNRWNERDERRVRKVLLSATMTQDVSKLLALQLRRPKLLIVQDDSGRPDISGSNDKQLLELPQTLTEFCIPVGDGSEKPLHLIQLLESKAIPSDFFLNAVRAARAGNTDMDDGGSGDDEVESSDDDSGSETSDISSSDPSSSDTSSDTSETSSTISATSEANNVHPARAALVVGSIKGSPTSPPTALIFASSNEAAMRLSRLIKLLRPEWAPWITTLAKSRQKVVFGKKDQPSLTISTDRAARGLDTISNRHITHVFQYDVPRSLESYVHRVGRTARAGRSGEAYTLYTHSEARWFLQQVARTPRVRRTSAVEKIEVAAADEALRKRFARALDRMRGEVSG